MAIKYPEIERRDNLSANEFHSDYIGKKPVIINGLIKEWPALRIWDENYFCEMGKDISVKVKVGNVSEKREIYIPFHQYLDLLLKGKKYNSDKDLSYYLHDFPLPTILEQLRFDIQPFPLEYIANWYHYRWWRNIFFFYGAQNKMTPLHFDNLGTHNNFYQICGRKKFIIIPPSEHTYCYMHRYSWSRVDPENPDLKKYPLFKNASPMEAILNPGDFLYMPPFTLHHVRSLDTCISINIDWHTRKTILLWTTKLFQGMAWSRIYYNLIYFTGIGLGIPAKSLYFLYKHYLRTG